MSWATPVRVLQPVKRRRSRVLFARRRGSTTIDLRPTALTPRRRLRRAA